MAILAGIDLLAKFLKGDDTGQVGQRFRDYITKYFQPISPGDEEVIYQLRNSLLHSFGLYSKSKSKTYRFIVSANDAQLINNIDSDIYQVDIIALHRKFEDSIEKYANDVNSDVKLQRNFLDMFSNYGAVGIGQKV